MFEQIINIRNFIKPKIREDFLFDGGSEKNIKDSTKIKKTFENNQKIDRSMMVSSLTKLFNNISNDVIQKNSASAAAAAGAGNTMFIRNVECDEINITGVKQNAQVIVQQQIQSQQVNVSKISNEISSSIDKTIEKVGYTDLEALQAENTKQLNELMSQTPGYDPDKAHKMSSTCSKDECKSLVCTGNKCDIGTSYELDQSIKQSLGLDESFKITDEDNISNEIKNKMEQVNIASCEASASANNLFMIEDIKCKLNDTAKKAGKTGKVNISDVEQNAVAQLYQVCVFDQKNVSDIVNKMVNKISKRYNQIYDAVAKKALSMGEQKGMEYYKKAGELLDTFIGAGIERIHAAAGELSEKTAETETKDETSSGLIGSLPKMEPIQPIDLSKQQADAKLAREKQEADAKLAREKQEADAKIAAEKIKQQIELEKQKVQAEIAVAEANKLTKMWLIIGGISILILILIIIIVFFMMNSNKVQSTIQKMPSTTKNIISDTTKTLKQINIPKFTIPKISK
jgi:hypothetical protein